ncbi:MAG: hypothetical protein U0174_17360 [Polyangiaceae bacterium]
MTSLARGLRAVPFVLLLSAPSFAADKDGPVDPEIPRLVDRIQPNLPAPKPPSSSPPTPNRPYSPSSSGSNNNANTGYERPRPPKRDDEEEEGPKLDEKHPWGAFGSRALAGGFYATGEDIARVAPPPATPLPAGTTPTVERKYTRAGGYIGLEFGVENAKIFDDALLLGLELWLQAGVAGGSKYKDGTFLKDSDGDDKKLGFFGRSDLVATIAPLNWSGPIAGRITLIPGVGGYLDSGRFYESYFYLMGGGRLSLLFGGKIALHGQYMIAPFTSASAFSILEHRIEGSFSFKRFIMGFRAQLESVGEGDTKATGATKESMNTTLGGFLGVGFK